MNNWNDDILMLLIAYFELIIFILEKKKRYIYKVIFFILIFAICRLSKSDIVLGISLIACGTILLYDNYQNEKTNKCHFLTRSWFIKFNFYGAIILIIFYGFGTLLEYI